MRYVTSQNAALNETVIDLSFSCYTDSMPLLSKLIFRKQDVNAGSQCVPLACALLTTAHCGEQFEFPGMKIGSDYAEAISTLFDRRLFISNVDGMMRNISTGEIDVYVACATHPPGNVLRSNGHLVPLARLDWSSDFVEPIARSSRGFAFGAYHTNASLFADDTTVSIAVGLLHGRERIRTLMVPEPSSRTSVDVGTLTRALRIVGVKLEFTSPSVGEVPNAA